MTSSTSTTTPLTTGHTLPDGRLTLVRLSAEYPVGMRPTGLRDYGLRGDGDDDGRTFYASRSAFAEGYVSLIVPDTDPRHRGMWTLDTDTAARAGLSERRDGYHGWNVEVRYVSLVDSDDAEDPDGPSTTDPLTPGEVISWGSRVQWFRVGEDGRTGTLVTPHGDGYTTDVSVYRDDPAWIAVPVGAVAALTPDPDAVAPVREAVQRERESRQRWVDELVSDAHEYADRNDLCGEFDRFMSEHGLPTRPRTYMVDMTVRMLVEEVSSEEEAADAARERVADVEGCYSTHVESADVY